VDVLSGSRPKLHFSPLAGKARLDNRCNEKIRCTSALQAWHGKRTKARSSIKHWVNVCAIAPDNEVWKHLDAETECTRNPFDSVKGLASVVF
jgi:hypothetical protein